MDYIYSDFISGSSIASKILTFIEKYGQKIIREEGNKKIYAIHYGMEKKAFYATVQIREKDGSRIINEILIFFIKDFYDPTNIQVFSGDTVIFEEKSFTIVRTHGNRKIRFFVE